MRPPGRPRRRKKIEVNLISRTGLTQVRNYLTALGPPASVSDVPG